ncbi:MAG: hypothetical protein GY950_21190, partial [bacterium]|nr:hypothetical protein [bacterium]
KKVRWLIIYPVIFWLYLFPLNLGLSFLNGNVREIFVYSDQMHWQDYLFAYPTWWGLAALLGMVPFFFLLDILGLVGRLKKAQWRWPSYLKIGVMVLFLIYGGIRMYLDTEHVRVSGSEVSIEGLPREFQGLRITFFGDTHVDRYTNGDKLSKLKDILQSGEEDLVFFSGDLISRGMNFISPAMEVVAHPQGKLANIAVMGDHDYWTNRWRIPGELEKNGWTFLEDRHIVIPHNGHRILVTGITHVYSRRMMEYALKRFLKSAPGADLKIMLVHQPLKMVVETAAEYGYHLLLGGHTHGGQLVFHIFGIPVSPGQEETPYWRGRHRVGDMEVVVTNGIGMTLAPVRYHAPAEINRITLK